MGNVRKITVATFCEPGETRRSKVRAYTLYFNPQWKNCMVVEVTAVSGADAKRFAIDWRLAKEAGRAAPEPGPAQEGGDRG